MPRLPKLNIPLLVAMLLWGFNFIAVKLVLREMTPNALALVRTVLCYAALVPYFWIRGISLAYPRGQVWRILLQGALAMGIYLVVFFQGMKYSTAAEGAIILGTSPAFTLLFAVLVRQERFRLKALAGIVVAFCGVVLVVLSGPVVVGAGVTPAQKMQGNLTVLAAAVVWAISVVVTRPLVGKVEPLRLFTLSMPGAIAATLPFGIMDVLHTDFSRITPIGWAMLLYVAYVAGVIGFALFYQGVKDVGSSGAMVYQYFVSPLAAMFGWAILGTPLSALQLLGLVVVLSGVAISSSVRQVPKEEPLPGIAD